VATRAAATNDFQASIDYSTSDNINIIIMSASSAHPAADMTPPLSLLTQSLVGDLWWRIHCSRGHITRPYQMF
jgi:hypothetical protein